MELRRENISQYLREHLSDIDLFDKDTQIDAIEIGDGNLNYVYRVFDTSNPVRSIVLKQAPPYIKILGPDYPLPPERLTFEYQALKTFTEFTSDTIPILYYFDNESAILAMEDLQEYRLLRDELIEGHVNPSIPMKIGRFMGIVHSHTYFRNLDNKTVQEYKNKFDNSIMQEITADYVFTLPFTQHETNFYTEGLKTVVEQLKSDELFLQQTYELKSKFQNEQQGLTHGDLHTGSIMVCGESAKVIDSEFAFYGPVGFDVGLFWANYLLSYYSHTDNSDVQSQIKASIIDSWQTYTEEFRTTNSINEQILQDIFHESVGFAGMEMLRRIVGAAHVKDIENIENEERKIIIETAILKFAKTIVLEHQNITTIHELIDIL
ncbi:S-methyl-5-thioribose kinase [Candidatus Poribacteria bacterium]|nr:S-methyl-5-thioribose kinase [Candidatus Poribacteria bacterium]